MTILRLWDSGGYFTEAGNIALFCVVLEKGRDNIMIA